MTDRQPLSRDVQNARLSSAQYEENFSDLHAPLDWHEAKVEAERCYFCYDAPCMTACPTSIDIPLFIRQIAAENPTGVGKNDFQPKHYGAACVPASVPQKLCVKKFVCAKRPKASR